MKDCDNKVLAICIPSYNRCDALCKLVEHLLSCKDSRFCVHVSDNCSIDATLERLSAITDERLSVTSTISNIPAYDNYHNAIITARADFALLLLDKETLDTSLIPDYIDFLLEKKPVFGILGNRFKIPAEERYCVYLAGNEAIMRGGVMVIHTRQGSITQQKSIRNVATMRI